MHELKIVDDRVYLDGFQLKGVKDYTIRNSANPDDLIEITLTLLISNSELSVD